MSEKVVVKQFRWFFKKSYITHRDGNAAFRIEGGYRVTGSGIDKSDMTEKSFIDVDDKGAVLDNPYGLSPSIETGAHVAILNQSKKNCSVHVHSPNTVALAALFSHANGFKPFRPQTHHLVEVLNTKWPELFRYTKVGYVVPFLDPGSAKLHDSIVGSMGYWTEKAIYDPEDPEEVIDMEDVKAWNDICIMMHHGVMATGDTMDQCMEHIVRLEHIATILLKIITASGNLEAIL